MKRLLGLFLIFAGLVLVACGGDEDSTDASSSPPESTATAPTSGAQDGGSESGSASRRRGLTVKLLNTPNGKVLTNGRGQVLYLFTREKSDRSRCYGDCADAWPPAYTRGKPRAANGVDASLLGTTKRRGGRRTITYNGHPLYYYAHEDRRQVLCQGVDEFGGIWYVVAPSGRAITERFSVS